jgi:hypothetical protein
LQNATVQGKNEIMAAVEEREKQQMEANRQQLMIEHAKLETELQLNTARAVNEMTWAKERDQRSKADVGLYEERLSQITKNKSMALKDKVDALQKLLDVITQHGELEAAKNVNRLQELGNIQNSDNEREKLDAQIESHSSDFLTKSMAPQRGNAQTRSALL